MTAANRSRAWTIPMVGRDTDEQHRVSTPLELLFDLTFVVAVGRLAAELGHSIEAGHIAHGIGSYLMLFFGIYWAWLNFTWFASAFDTDDVGYRLLTLLQMAGVLILAASVDNAFEHGHFGGTVVGYVVMRVAMVAQWLRVAFTAPARRRTGLRYAAGVLTVQVLWVVWVLLPLPRAGQVAGFLLLVIGEIAVPWWAERAGETSWHAHHIAERYGLFTLIVLGECVLASSNALEEANSEHAALRPLLVLGVGGLVLLFGLWWLYYLRDAADGLAEHRNHAGFRWGYGHYVIFASLAALGAGLEVAAAATTTEVEASDLTVSYAVAIPICLFLLLLYYMRRLLPGIEVPGLTATGTAILATLVIAGFAAGFSLAPVVAALAVPTVLLVAWSIATEHRNTLAEQAHQASS